MPIARITGRVEEAGEDWLVVGVGPVGLQVSVPARTASACATGEAIALYTHLHVREDALSLFGFATAAELRLFEQLIGVSGVGPRVALAMLSALEPDALAGAIVSGRSDALRKVPGIGQKTAERIVIDLRDKVTPPDSPAPTSAPRATGDTDHEVVAALLGLGYTQAEAAAAAAGADGDLPLEERVRAALRAFARL